MSASRTAAAALAASALLLAGCGGGGAGSSSSAQSTETKAAPAAAASAPLSLRADPGGALRFDKKALTARAGTVTIVMRNPAPLSHDVSIVGPGIDKHGEVVGKGGTSRVSAALKAGSYTFYCSVPGHRQAGMEGTLTVR